MNKSADSLTHQVMLALSFLSFLSFVFPAAVPPVYHVNQLRRLFHSKTQLRLLEGDVKGARGEQEAPDAMRAAYPEFAKRLEEIHDSERLTAESYARSRFPTIHAARTAILKNDDGEVESRMALLEKYPKWFSQKQYYTRDPYGLDVMKKIVKKQGDDQKIIFLDQFGSMLPHRLIARCANPERFQTGKESKYGSSHGGLVASVAIDPVFGVAPNARFVAKTLHDIFPRCKMPQKFPFMNYYVEANVNEIDPRILSQIDRALVTGDDVFEVEFEASGNYYEVQIPDLTEFNGAIVSMSIQCMDGIGDKRNAGTEAGMIQLISFASLLLQMIRRGALIIWAAGNDSLVLQHAQAYSVLKSLSIYRPLSFMLVVALDEDATSMAPLSNQPGEHVLQNYTIAAPGTNVQMLNAQGDVFKGSGTSASAPFIAGIVVLLKSNLPSCDNGLILRALLDTASPIVIRSSHSHMQKVPVVLVGIESCKLVPSKTYFYQGKDGNEKQILVTEEMISQGRAKYGVGRINVFRAYLHLTKILAAPRR